MIKFTFDPSHLDYSYQRVWQLARRGDDYYILESLVHGLDRAYMPSLGNMIPSWWDRLHDGLQNHPVHE